MNILIYLAIFSFKIIEDALATLRLIIVSNGKKVFGSILQFICTIIRVVLTGSVLINFMEDFFKIIAFSLGGLVGSYIGSFLEEKIALGTNLFIIKIKESKINLLIHKFNLNNYFELNTSNGLFFITIIPRKQARKIARFTHSIDDTAYIICEKIKLY